MSLESSPYLPVSSSRSSNTGVSISTPPWRLNTLRMAVKACSRMRICSGPKSLAPLATLGLYLPPDESASRVCAQKVGNALSPSWKGSSTAPVIANARTRAAPAPSTSPAPFFFSFSAAFCAALSALALRLASALACCSADIPLSSFSGFFPSFPSFPSFSPPVFAKSSSILAMFAASSAASTSPSTCMDAFNSKPSAVERLVSLWRKAFMLRVDFSSYGTCPAVNRASFMAAGITAPVRLADSPKSMSRQVHMLRTATMACVWSSCCPALLLEGLDSQLLSSISMALAAAASTSRHGPVVCGAQCSGSAKAFLSAAHVLILLEPSSNMRMFAAECIWPRWGRESSWASNASALQPKASQLSAATQSIVLSRFVEPEASRQPRPIARKG
mmetsp:Transcript_29449/g.65310  ORF Transcript_29449/g.65310 Transcript_29449/m.65310 type:complete len:389 (-) Transcript_29449:473-1639(-)